MKVSEALNILNSLDPNQEVVLTLGTPPKKYDQHQVVRDYIARQWVIDKDKWPTNPTTVTCSNNTVH